MNTAGYDCIVEVIEVLLNRSLSAAYHLTDLSKLASGKVGRFDYEIELQEPPTIQLLANKTLNSHPIQPATNQNIRVDLCAAIRLKAFGFWFKFELIASAIGLLQYDPASQKLKLDAKSIRMPDIRLENQTGWLQIFSLHIDLPIFVLNWFNSLLKSVIQAGLLDRYETIDVAAFSLDLPNMPAGDENKLTITPEAIKILPHDVLAVAVNFLDQTGGDAEQIMDFSEHREIGTAISEAALHRVFDFWWGKTTWPKEYSLHEEKVVNELKELDKKLSYLTGMGINLEILVDSDIRIVFGKPEINLLNNSKVGISKWTLTISAKIIVRLRIIDLPEFLKETVEVVVTDNEWTKEEKNLFTVSVFETDGPFEIQNAEVELGLDEKYRLMVMNIKNAKVDLSQLNWYDGCLNILVVFVVENLKKCTFPLSPSLITINIPVRGINTQIQEPELVWTETELTLRAGFLYTDMPKRIPSVPRFIAVYDKSSSPQSKVHRSHCLMVGKAAEKEKIGYYTLIEAFQDGSSGCRSCHTDIHGITLGEKQEVSPGFEPFEHGTPIHR